MSSTPMFDVRGESPTSSYQAHVDKAREILAKALGYAKCERDIVDLANEASYVIQCLMKGEKARTQR